MSSEITNRQLEIIQAAGKILTTSGVGGLTIKNLALEMHFSESAIYRHFKSKEDIIVALLDFLAQDMDDRYSKIITPDLSSTEKFSVMFKNQFTFFKDNPHFVVAVFSDGLMEESARINQAILNIMQVKMKHLRPIILEGQLSGEFTSVITTEELMQIVMGTFRLQMFKWRLTHFQADILSQGKHMIHSLLTLLKK